MADSEGYVEFITEVPFNELIHQDDGASVIEWLNNYVSAKFIRDDENCLEDLTYAVAPPGATFKGLILIKVRASISSWLAYEQAEAKLDQVMSSKQP